MPDTQTLVNEITEELKKAQKAQFQEIEPQIQEAIKSGKGIAELSEKMAKANTEVSKCIETLATLEERLADEKTEAQARIDGLEKRLGEGLSGPEVIKSAGRQYTDDVATEAKADSWYDEAKMPAQKLKLRPDYIHRRKSISTDAASAGAAADTLRLPGVVVQPEPALVVQQMLTVRQVASQTIDWIRELLYTDNAATVAETTDAASLTAKPESDITYEEVNDRMRTIAHWIPVSRQALRYVNRFDLGGQIDTRLRDRVLRELENQVLTGDGTGQNLNGLIPNATAYNRGYAQIQGNDPTELDTLRRAITQLQLANYAPNGCILHPGDWEEIDLLKDTQLRYILAMGPQGVNSRTVWGVPVMISNLTTNSEFLIGDFSSATVELLIGEQLNVRTSDSHGDFFTANMVAVLAEMDACLCFYRPEAIITGEIELAS